MQTGFVLFDGKSEFVARYEVDDWSSEDFIEGTIYGIEKAKNNTYIVLLKNNKFFKRKMCLIFPLKPYIIGISR